MAAGDLLILKNGSDTSAAPNASTIDLLWDTVVQGFGLSSGNASITGRIPLAAGRYLVMYSEYFTTTNTINNERIELQGEIHTTGGGLQGGFGQGYIRKISGDQDAAVRGSMILDLASPDDVFIRIERTDDSTSGTVNRVPNRGQLVILQLDTSHAFGLYSKTVAQNLTGTVASTVTFPTTDIQDNGFNIANDVVTIANAGRYLVTYSIDISETTTDREDIISYLRNAGIELTGTRGYCYLRGSDGAQDGAVTWIGIIDLPAGATIDLQAQCPTSATIIMHQAALQFWQLPASADTIIMEATNGNYNTNGNFQFDTVEHIDTNEFTASGATDTITLDNGNAFLAFATLSQLAPDTVQRGVPRLQFELGGSLIEGVADVYHRNSGGTGAVAVTAASGFFADGSGLPLSLNITATAATGTMNNDLGQFSVLSLSSIFGTYVPPPTITLVDGDNQIVSTSVNVVISGDRFGAVQGTGTVELWSNTSGTVAVPQSVDSWSNTSIQFDADTAGLTDQSTIYIVVTDNNGEASPAFPVFLGLFPLDDYFTVFGNTNPDHWWRFDNDAYADSAGANPFTAAVFGNGGAFQADPICEQNTHSWLLNDQAAGGRRECANSANMNTATLQTRTMAGWVRFNQIDTALSCVYEEGGGVNNVCLLIGLGGILIASYADTGDDNVQAYSDFRLAPNRDYFVTWLFNHVDENQFLLYIDGVQQSVTSGNPLTSGNLDAHSGDITMGGQGSNLEVGGTDVAFQAQLATNYANWASWRQRLDDETLLELFRRGARPNTVVASNTPAAMQTFIDGLSGTAFANHAMSMRIFEPNTGAVDNLSLDFDNITFDPSTSIQLEWRGGGVLTITNLNGSNLDLSKCYASRGGTIVVQNPAVLTLTGLTNPTEVRVFEAGTEIEVAGQEDVTTGTFSASVQVNAVDIVIHSLNEQYQRLLNVDTSNGDVTLPIQQRQDRQFDNP